MATTTLSRSDFIEVHEPNLIRGLGSLVKSELSTLYRNKRWWIQLMWMLLMCNGIGAIVMASEPGAEAIFVFSIFLGMWPVFSTIILMQGVIIDERLSGTAEWILSKPVSRNAFIAAKLINNTIATSIFIILIPGFIGYLQFTLVAGIPIRFGVYLNILFLVWIHTMIYLTLCLFMGTIFRSRRAVMGIAFTAFILQSMLGGLIPPEYLWISIVIPSPEISMTQSIIMGMPFLSVIPIYSALISISMFIGLAFWQFKRIEF